MSRQQGGSVYDAIVCGGGPAGLTAALWLGRYRRRTLVLNAGSPRNGPTTATHGIFTRDGSSPDELLAAGTADLGHYDTVTLHEAGVETIERAGDVFHVSSGEDRYTARRIILAMGIEDAFPDLPGFGDLYGKSIFHCTSCDAFEGRDKPIVAIGWGRHSAGFALDLLDWAEKVTLVTDGQSFEGDEPERDALARNGIELIEDHVETLICPDGELQGVGLSSGRVVDAALAFFTIAHSPRSGIARALGCELDDEGYVVVDENGDTSIEGVYAAGDLTPGIQLVAVAAGEGAKAGIACALSLKGHPRNPEAPAPGPDPGAELDAVAKEAAEPS